jgi:hypothetical protein
VPYSIGEEASRRWREYVEELEAVLAEGRRGDAVELFMRVAGASEEDIAGARNSPMWPGLEAIAASVPYSERLTIEGQTHVADPKALAPVLERFFGQ